MATMGGYFSSFFESVSQMFGDAQGNKRFLMVGLDNAGKNEDCRCVGD